jgi:hypothetical protein
MNERMIEIADNIDVLLIWDIRDPGLLLQAGTAIRSEFKDVAELAKVLKLLTLCSVNKVDDVNVLAADVLRRANQIIADAKKPLK